MVYSGQLLHFFFIRPFNDNNNRYYTQHDRVRMQWFERTSYYNIINITILTISEFRQNKYKYQTCRNSAAKALFFRDINTQYWNLYNLVKWMFVFEYIYVYTVDCFWNVIRYSLMELLIIFCPTDRIGKLILSCR